MATETQSRNFKKFRDLLEQLFRMDQADLDFGIYRIINQKREEISRFLDHDLLPQVKQAFALYASADQSHIKDELEKLVQTLTDAGVDPETSPKVQELQAQLQQSVDVLALEDQVFSHLANFFQRYYDKGDFLSQRRYKEGVYAIPYEGEEVKLHWANADQYYVKTTEHFTNFTFKLPSGRKVHFQIVAGSTEHNNNKEPNGKERRFVLSKDRPVIEENGELYIRFEYRSQEGKARQEDLNEEALETILEAPGLGTWVQELKTPAPTERNKDRTLLEKYLTEYTSRNTFDYFIHKDLGGFLRRELDFYIKNEVMHLDDIEHESAPKVEQYLSMIKVIRSIAHKIIAFLEQVENFQKKLWLKKKFVIETNWCITLDRIPDELYPEIAENDAQREEWVRLFAIDEIEGDLTSPGYSNPLTVEFLKANTNLVLDTRHFSEVFKTRLVASIDDLDEQCDGVLIHSENFQALNLVAGFFQGKVDLIYIDPPYNTDASEIMYKNGYKDSSWLALISDRIGLSLRLLKETGMHCLTIDDYEYPLAQLLLNERFGRVNHLATICIRNNPSGRSTVKGFSVNHEYAIFHGADASITEVGRLPHTGEQASRYEYRDEKGVYEWENLRKSSAESDRASRPKQFFPIYVNRNNFRIRLPELEWNDIEKKYIVLDRPRENEAVVLPVDQFDNERVWRWGLDRVGSSLSSLEAREVNGRIEIYGRKYLNDRGVLPRTWWDKPEYSARDHGTRVLRNMIKDARAFDFPKAVEAVKDAIRIGCSENGVVFDYFAGSGTTGHAVINLNREDGGKRKYILVEMGTYFDTVLKPRIAKAVYAAEWKDGKPVSRNTGISHCFKYIRLESYEDTLNNLELKRTEQQANLLETNADLREEYMLSYMLEFETKGSQSLLNIDGFRNPYEYKLKIERDGEIRWVNVDLVETLNWLLGLKVNHMDFIRGVRVIDGTNPEGERVLVLWRNVEEMDNDALDDWFKKQGYSTRDLEYDVIYVNGDNNLENWRRPDQTWKVRLIEEEFHRLMFNEARI